MNTQILIAFFLTGMFLVAAGIIMAYLLSPKSFNKQKNQPYECGIPTKGKTWLQFNVGYYLYSLLFLIFDVETVFLFPWATVMQQVSKVGFIEIVLFFLILVLGLAYAWKKKALEWLG